MVSSHVQTGQIVFTLLGSNTYVGNGVISRSDGFGEISGTSITLGGALDRVNITTLNGTDTFDAGSVNIIYE